MNPELLDMLLRMGIENAFANQQILGRDPRQFIQATERVGSQIQGRGEDPMQNPTFDLMSQLVLAALDQGMMGTAPSNSSASPSILDFFSSAASSLVREPDRSQSGRFLDIIFDVLNRTKDSDQFRREQIQRRTRGESVEDLINERPIPPRQP